MVSRGICAFIALAAFCAAGTAAVANPTWLTNGQVVCSAGDSQETPVLLSLGAEGAIIAWGDRRSGDFDVYLQKLDTFGRAKWPQGGVRVCGQVYDQQLPSIVSDGTGGAIVCWQDGRLGDDGTELYAQRVSSDGLLLWAAEGVPVCTHAAGMTNPPAAYAQVMLADGAGGAYVVWRDTRTDVVTGNTEIYAQHIDGSGAIVSGWVVNGIQLVGFTTGSWATRNPVLADDGTGGMVVVWQDARNLAASGNDVYAQRVTSAGTALWAGNGVLVCCAPADQGYMDVMPAGGGSVTVVWEDKRSGNYDVYAQKLSSAGAGLWGANGKVVISYSGDQRTPRVVGDGSGGAVVAWADSRTTPSGPDVYAQRLDSSGAALWAANGIPVSTAAGWQGRIRMSAGLSGSTVLIWMDNRCDPSGATLNYDIYGQLVDTAGSSQWVAGGLATSAVAGSVQRLQQAATDGAGGAYVVWEDNRKLGEWDIYAQRMTPLPLAVPVADIAAAKARPDDTYVSLPARVVTGWFGDCFYLEEPHRYSGIRVISPEISVEGEMIAVTGLLSTSGERTITATSITRAGFASPLGTLGIVMDLLGGSGFTYAPAVGQAAGLNTVGLLVRTTGQVEQVVLGQKPYFTLRSGALLLKVRGTTSTSPGNTVVVSGVCSCEPSAGGWAPVILTRSASDVRPVN